MKKRRRLVPLEKRHQAVARLRPADLEQLQEAARRAARLVAFRWNLGPAEVEDLEQQATLAGLLTLHAWRRRRGRLGAYVARGMVRDLHQEALRLQLPVFIGERTAWRCWAGAKGVPIEEALGVADPADLADQEIDRARWRAEVRGRLAALMSDRPELVAKLQADDWRQARWVINRSGADAVLERLRADPQLQELAGV